MNQTTILAIVLGVLVIIAAVQAYQFTEIKSKISSGAVPVAAASSGHSGGGAAMPASLQNLPQMVGGC